MISLEEATNILRKRFPKVKILSGFLFRGKYVFEICSVESKGNDGFGFEVLQDGTVTLTDTDEIFNNLDEYAEACKKAVKIDEV